MNKHGHCRAIWRNLLPWWPPFALIGAISLASGGNPMAPPLTIFTYDKLIHLLVFGLLATAFYRATPRRWPDGFRAVLAISATSLFGLLDELHQSTTPGRYMELDDWLADTFGAVLAVYTYRGWAFYRKVLEWGIRREPQKTMP